MLEVWVILFKVSESKYFRREQRVCRIVSHTAVFVRNLASAILQAVCSLCSRKS